MVKALSVRLGHKLGQSLQANNDEIEVYSYAFELLLCGLIEILFLFFFALLFGIFTNTLLVFLAFAGFRIPGGGAHMQTYMHCVIKGLVLQLTFAYLSTFYMPIEVIIALFGLMILLALTTIIFWVPAGTEKNLLINPLIAVNKKWRPLYFYQSG
nr:accessory gene regulator B family protein [Syntrophomonas palmitatica]